MASPQNCVQLNWYCKVALVHVGKGSTEISLLSTNKFNIFVRRINYQTFGSRAVKMLEISQVEGF